MERCHNLKWFGLSHMLLWGKSIPGFTQKVLKGDLQVPSRYVKTLRAKHYSRNRNGAHRGNKRVAIKTEQSQKNPF